MGGSSEGGTLAVQGSIRRTEVLDTLERAVFLKGRNMLLSIGPSQKKQVPGSIAGLRRMTQSDSLTNRLEEESFSATFNSSVTMDTNANSRTLEQEVELLTRSLEEAGLMRWRS